MTTDARHSKATPTNIGVHVVHAYEYADATARTSATGFVPADVGKVARQLDNETFWVLCDDSPVTWSQIDSAGSAGLTSNNPVDVTKAAAAVGTGTEAARDDHKHDISTAIVGSVTPGDSALEGSATSLARSDHQHSIAAFGASGGTFCEGNDSRLSDSRTPLAHNTSHQSGGSDPIKLDDLAAPDDNTDLNASTSAHGLLQKLPGGTTDFLRADGSFATPPGVPLASVAPVDVTKATAQVGTGTTAARDDHKHDISTGVVGAITPGDTALEGSATSLARSDHRHSIPAYGTGSGTFCEGNDSRLSDSRTPLAHNTSHQSGGSDPIKLDDLATPDDNTDLDATTSRHGLLLKLGGGTTDYLRADGSWAAPVVVSQASATADTTITSDIATVINSMTITPGAGDYVAMFSASMATQAGGDTMQYAIYSNGAEVTHSERLKAADDANAIHTQAYITSLGASQAIDVRGWNTAGGKTSTIYERSLILVKVG